LEKLAALQHSSANQRILPGQRRDLARELACAMLDNRPFPFEGRLNDFHFSRKQHKQWNRAIARFKQDFAGLNPANVSQGTNPFDLRAR
jgi:hypothetical protein